jgi:hypothetical protein
MAQWLGDRERWVRSHLKWLDSKSVNPPGSQQLETQFFKRMYHPCISYHIHLWQSYVGSFHHLQPPWQYDPVIWEYFVQKKSIKWGSPIGQSHSAFSFPVPFHTWPSVLSKRGYKWPASGPRNSLIEWRFIKTVLMVSVVSGIEKQPRGFQFSTSFLTSIYKAELSSRNIRTEQNNGAIGF